MSEEQLKHFLVAIKADAALQVQLKSAKDADSVAAIAKAAGFIVSAEDLIKFKGEISEEELEAFSGSRGPWCPLSPVYTDPF